MGNRKEGRNSEIYKFYLSNHTTLRQMGNKYNITPERVRQIILREIRTENIRVLSPTLIKMQNIVKRINLINKIRTNNYIKEG